MSGFIYIWYDCKHKRYYVGSHWGTPDDGYVCSSSWMKKAYKLRPQDFKRRIIATVETTRADLLIEEQRWLDMMKDWELKGPRYYNIQKTTGYLWFADKDKCKTVGERISATMARPEVRARRSEALKRAWAIRSPVEDRYVGTIRGSSEHTEKVSKKMSELWEDQGYRDKIVAAISKPSPKRSAALKNKPWTEKRRAACPDMKGYLWYNDGLTQMRTREKPGVEWQRGQLPNRGR